MTNPFLNKHAEEIRQTWQSRALAAAEGKLACVLLVALSFEYAGAMPVLLRVTFPGFTDIVRPFLSGYATIVPSGKVACNMVDKDGVIKVVAVYASKDQFVGEMRRLADKLKFTDSEREEFFGVLSRWIVKDMRVGPHGERLAS